MQFKEISNHKYIRYIVKVESSILKSQKMTNKEKTFKQIQRAIAYINRLKAEIKKFPELYPNSKIIMEKIVTKLNTYEILEENDNE